MSRANVPSKTARTKYYQQSINQMNAANFLNNSLSSSISYSKTFPGEPQVNMSLSATHSQNTNTQTINMTLPTFQGSVSRIYPLFLWGMAVWVWLWLWVWVWLWLCAWVSVAPVVCGLSFENCNTSPRGCTKWNHSPCVVIRLPCW